MSFSAMRKAAALITEQAEQAGDGPPLDVAPKLSVIAGPESLVASAAALVEPSANAATTAGAPTETSAAADAPTSFDDELNAVAITRDIHAESVAPPTLTEAEVEKAAAATSPVGGDPLTPGNPITEAAQSAASATATEGSATSLEGAGKASGPAEEASAEPDPFKIDEEELRGYGLDKPTIDAIAGLNIERARDVISEIRSKNSAVNDLQKRKSDLENAITARRVGTPGGGGVFAALANMFQGPTAEAKALRRTDGELGKVQDYLGNGNIRDRVQTLRRQEIVDAANSLSQDNRRLSAASKAFNTALLSTQAGQAFDAEIEAITARHPDLDRRKVVAMHMDGTLVAKLGADTLTPHVRDAFQDDRVKKAWDKMAATGDAIENRSEALVDRLKNYEEHFPGSTDSEKLQEEVSKAMEGLEKTFGEPMAQNPEDEREWKDRMRKIAKAIQEFIEKLVSVFRKGPKL
jgi:hypothetical protein